MRLPLRISFRNMDGSPAIEAEIREKATQLDALSDHITNCRVVVELAEKHRVQGHRYKVYIDTKLSGGELAATREPSQHKEYKGLAVAIRDAFDSVARQIEDCVRRQLGDAKRNERLPQGRVSKLVSSQSCDFARDA